MSIDTHRLLHFVRDKLNEAKAEHSSHLAGGGAKEFHEYRHVCGVIRGLTYAESIILDLVQRMETDDE